MGTNTIRLDDDIYERLKAKKRADETFSDAVDRLITDWSLLDFAEGDAPVDSETHRELLAESDRQSVDAATARLERHETDGEE